MYRKKREYLSDENQNDVDKETEIDNQRTRPSRSC